MANLCTTYITFYSKSETALLALKQKIEETNAAKLTHKDSSGYSWLGEIVKSFYSDIDASSVDCRGVLTDIGIEVKPHREFYEFDICTQTAWTAKIGMWHKILKDFYPEVKLAYIAEESGCDYYVKWDEDNLYDFDYYFDICCPAKNGESAYTYDHESVSLKGIFAWLDKHLTFEYSKTSDIYALETEIQDKLEALDDDEYFCTIAQYEKVSPSEFVFFLT